MDFLWIGLSTFFLGLLSVFWLRKFYPVFGLMDNPEKYGHDREAVPYSAGLVFVILFVLLSASFLPLTSHLIFLYLAVVILGGVSFLDDNYDLSPILRFSVQMICALIVVYSGVQALEITNPMGGDNLKLLWLAPIVSVIWIVSLTNLLNFLDGISGLTSGVSSIGFLVIFLLSIWPGMHLTDQTVVSEMALILAILAFLAAVFEFPKPSLLIGDSGTMFFGFMLGVLTLLNGAKLATVTMVMLLPLLDGTVVILKRIIDGKLPWKGDKTHSHHRLMMLGFSERVLLLIYYSVTFLFGVIALFAWNTFFKVGSLLVLSTACFIIVYYLWTQEKR